MEAVPEQESAELIVNLISDPDSEQRWDCVCMPHCMEAHDIKAEQLLQGVEVMNDQTMMEKIRRNPSVFTY